MTLAALPSRTPLHPMRAAARIDPYWSHLWRAGSVGDWLSRRDADSLAQAGVSALPGWLAMPHERAWRRIESSLPDATKLLGFLDQWRTATAQQLQYATGVERVFDSMSSWTSTLWSAGLIEVCLPGAGMRSGAQARAVTLLRPARESDDTRRLESMLTWPEWVATTGGLGFSSDRQFARHNVLATEFGLRAAEFGDVGAVLGERLSTMATLAYEGVGDGVPSSGVANSGDLTLVRGDGLRIAVEVTASKIGGWFARKVERIAVTLHRRPIRATGLVVLFVVAPHQDAGSAEVTEAMRLVKRAIASAVRLYPGTFHSPTAARLGVVAWSDLFPAPGEATVEAPLLPVQFPAALLPGAVVGDDERIWQTARWLDRASSPFYPDDAAAMTAVIDNAARLHGSPAALRDRAVLGEDDLLRLSLSNAGVLDLADELQARTRGAVGEARSLPRLRWS